MTDEAHQARVEAIARIIDPEAFGLPNNIEDGTITDRDEARDRATIIIAADPATAQLDHAIRKAECHMVLSSCLKDKFATANAQLKQWQEMVDSTNQTNAAMGRRLQEQEDKLVADTARIIELNKRHEDVLEVLRKADAEIDRLTGLKEAAETGCRLGKGACDIYRAQLADAKEALRAVRQKVQYNHVRDALLDFLNETLKRLEGSDDARCDSHHIAQPGKMMGEQSDG